MSEYWRKRILQLEEALNNRGVEYFHDLEELYTQAANKTQSEIIGLYTRLATQNGLTLTEARKMLTSNELEEFRWTVNEYITYAKAHGADKKWVTKLENASLRYRISRLEAMKIQMQNQVEVLMGQEVDGLSKLMSDIYTESYYRTAYTIHTKLGLKTTLAKLDAKKVEKVLSKPWTPDGKNFSERIWGKHRPNLINKLHKHLTQAIIRGESPQKLINTISKDFKVSKGQAGNLVMTESSYFNTVAQQECYDELGVEKQEFVATLDERTSDICRSMDGKVFKSSEIEIGVNAPPMHCRCRSVLVPYYEDNITERAARDSEGKSVYVEGNPTYEEWRKKYVK